MLLAHHPLRTLTFVPLTALPIETKIETLPNVLRFDSYPIYRKCCTTPVSELKLLKALKSASRRLSLTGDALFLLVSSTMWTVRGCHHLPLKNGCEGLLRTSSTRPWTLSHHFEDVALRNYRTERSTGHDMLGLCRASDQQLQPRDDIVEEDQQAPSSSTATEPPADLMTGWSESRQRKFFMGIYGRSYDETCWHQTSVKYVILWYDYSSQEDTIEPPEHLLQHFIS